MVFVVLVTVLSVFPVAVPATSTSSTSLKVHVRKFTGLDIVRFSALNEVAGFLRRVGEGTASEGKSSDQSDGRSSTHFVC
jgi:hypothetical protein